MALLGLDFEPRIPRLSDRRLYAFEPAKRYGRLAPVFGRRLDRDLIVAALPLRAITPSLILKKLSAHRRQNGLAAALREIGRIERTLFTLRWLDDAALRQTVTVKLNKGEARNAWPGRSRSIVSVDSATAASIISKPAPPRSTSSPRPSSSSTVVISAPQSKNFAAEEKASTPTCRTACRRWDGTASISPETMSGPSASISTRLA